MPRGRFDVEVLWEQCTRQHRLTPSASDKGRGVHGANTARAGSSGTKSGLKQPTFVARGVVMMASRSRLMRWLRSMRCAGRSGPRRSLARSCSRRHPRTSSRESLAVTAA